MEWTTIYVSSVTNAMRGKRLLEGQGYTVHMQRASHTNDNNGCGYSLLVRGNGRQAEEQLRQSGIRVLRTGSGGAPR